MKAFLKTVSNSAGEFFSPLRWVVPFVKDVFFDNLWITTMWVFFVLMFWWPAAGITVFVFMIIGVLTSEIRENSGNGRSALVELQHKVIELQDELIRDLTAQLNQAQEETPADEHRNDS